MKICSKCHIEKPTDQFYLTGNGYVGGICKECKIEYGKKRRNETGHTVDRVWYEKNKNKLNQKRKLRRQKDLEWRNQDVERSRNFRKENPSYSREYLREWVKRNKIQTNLRRRFKRAFGMSSPKISKLVGCDIGIFKNWLSKNFTPAMNWQNYGLLWSIDHIIPLSFAKSQEDMIQLFHYMNCRPLLVSENSAKNNRINPIEIQKLISIDGIPIKLLDMARDALSL
jgi:hypothetical protein